MHNYKALIAGYAHPPYKAKQVGVVSPAGAARENAACRAIHALAGNSD